MDTSVKIQVESKYTLDLLRDLWRVNYRKHRLITIIIFAVCIPLLVYLSLQNYWIYRNTFGFMLVFLSCIAFFILMYVFCGYVYKEGERIQKLSVTYTFNENEYTVHDLDGLTTLLYRNVIAVFETRKAFYLCIGPKKYNVISKTGFIKGNPDELSDLLSQHIKIQKHII